MNLKRWFVCVIALLLVTALLPVGYMPAAKASGLQNLALFQPYFYTYPSSPMAQYEDRNGVELTDGIYAVSDSTDSAWQGSLLGVDDSFALTINLRRVAQVSELSIRFMQDEEEGIYYPGHVRFSYSLDGIYFTELGNAVHRQITDKVRKYSLTLQGPNSLETLYVRASIDGLPDKEAKLLTDEFEVLGTNSNPLPVKLSQNKPYSSSIAAETPYPDSNGTELTDGLLAHSDESDDAWSGRNLRINKDRYYRHTIDLGETRHISEAALDFLENQDSGIHLPASVEFHYSLDGSAFHKMGFALRSETIRIHDGARTAKFRLTMPNSVEARFVQATVVAENWTLADEFEVFGPLSGTMSGPQPSDPPFETNVPTPAKPDYSNVALDKSYVTSIPAMVDSALNDGSGRQLTDGQFAAGLAQRSDGDSRWVGYELPGDTKRMDIVVDLSEPYASLSGTAIEFAANPSAGIDYPESVEISYSLDGVNYTGAGKAIPQVVFPGKRMFKLETAASAGRYVKIHIKGQSAIALNEIQLFDGMMHKPLIDGGFVTMAIISREGGGLDPVNFFTDEDWKREIRMMKDLGMTYIIITHTVSSELKTTVYPNPAMEGYEQASGIAHGYGSEDPIKAIMEEADALGMQVMIGGSINFNWYNNIGTTKQEKYDWIDAEAEIGKQTYRDLYAKYGGHSSFIGFYLSNETCDYWISEGQWEYARRLYGSQSLDIREYAPSAKVMISPAVWQTSSPAAYAADMFKMIGNGSGRPIVDIVAMQDGIGVGHVGHPPDYDKYEETLMAISKVVREAGAEFWNDTEIFKMPEYSAMNINWMEKSLNLEAKYSNVNIVFDITHYLNPLRIGGGSTHAYQQYKRYYERNKRLTEDTQAPQFAEGYPVGEVAGEHTASLYVKLNENGRTYYAIVPENSPALTAEEVKSGKDSQHQPLPAGMTGSVEVRAFVESAIKIGGLAADTKYEVYVAAEDGAGNLQQNTAHVTIVTGTEANGPVNAALGKAYTVDVPANASYPDTGNLELTNGFVGKVGSADNGWEEWQGRADIPTYSFTVDLGEKMKVDRFATTFLKGDMGNWIVAPNSVQYYGSEDNVNFTLIGEALAPVDAVDNSIIRYEIASVTPIAARYVKAQVHHPFAWSFIGEFEIYESEAPAEPDRYPRITDVSGTTASIDYKAAQSGTLYYVVVQGRNGAPTIQQIMQGQDESGEDLAIGMKGTVPIAEGDVAQLELADLQGSTDYSVYMVENTGAQPVKLNFTTDDIDAPKFKPGYPKTELVKGNSISVSVKMNEAGKAYYVALPQGDPALDAQQVKQGKDASGAQVDIAGLADVSVGSVGMFLLSGLTNETPFDIYVVAEDRAGNLQLDPTVLNVSTLSRNLALHQPYTSDVAASSSYADSGQRELTDGVAGGGDFTNSAWQGRSGASQYSFVVDLGQLQEVGSFVTSFFKHAPSGIYGPDKVSYFVSADGIHFDEAGTVNAVPIPDGSSGAYQITMDDNVLARYVKATIYTNQAWSFIDEFEIYAVPSSPKMLQFYPFVAFVGANDAQVMLKMNKKTNVYYVVVPEGETAPSQAQIKGGLNGNGNAGIRFGMIEAEGQTETGIALTELTKYEHYRIYLFAENTAGLQSAVYSLDFRPGGDNVALGKPYTADVQALDSYPDTGGAELTNGINGNGQAFGDQAWQARVSDTGAFRYRFEIDLEASVYVDRFAVRFLKDVNASINLPTSVTFAVYDEHSAYMEVGQVYLADFPTIPPDNEAAIYQLKLDSGVKAKSILIEVESPQGFSFIDEAEVYADKAPPEFVGELPRIVGNTGLSITAEGQLNEDADVFYIALPVGEAMPSVPQIVGGRGADDTQLSESMRGSISVRANEPFTITIHDLAVDQMYDIYIVAQDRAGNFSKLPYILKAKSADIRPPEWATTYPRQQLVLDTSAMLLLKAGESGEAYYVVLPGSATAPDSAQVAAGRDGLGQPTDSDRHGQISLAEAEETYLRLEGLAAKSEYAVYWVLKDADDNLSPTPVRLTFTTRSENAAFNKPYVSDVVAADGYPDADMKKLTDGRLGLNQYHDTAWQGRADVQSYSFVVDLQQETLLDTFIASFLKNSGAWISIPLAVTYSVSDDGVQFTEVGTVQTVNAADLSVANYELKLQSGVVARYTKLKVSPGPGWSFIDEFAVFNSRSGGVNPPVEPPVSVPGGPSSGNVGKETPRGETVIQPGRIVTSAEVREGVGEVTLTAQQLAAAIGAGSAVVVEIRPADGVAGYTIHLPASSLQSLGELAMKTPLGTIVLPDKQIDGRLLADGSTLTFSIATVEPEGRKGDLSKPVGPIVNIQTLINGERIDTNNGPLYGILRLPYVPTNGEKGKEALLTIRFLNVNGEWIPIVSGKYDEQTGEMVFKAPLNGTFAIAFEPISFRDMTGFDWAQNAIEALAARGVLNGVGDDRFAPEKDVTRADAVLMLVRALELRADAGEGFDDVRPDAYYADAIAMAKALGIVNGKDGKTFDPESPISRQDMMVMVKRASGATGLILETDGNKVLEAFRDADQISTYALNGIAALVHSGIVEGTPSGMLQPLKTMSRAEMAAIVYRVYLIQ